MAHTAHFSCSFYDLLFITKVHQTDTTTVLCNLAKYNTQSLPSALRHIIEEAGLSLNLTDHLAQLVVETRHSKGSLLIRQGHRCNDIYIIEQGFARIYSIVSGRETTTLFARENDIITSTFALFTKLESREFVEILEDSVLLKIDYEEFFECCREHGQLMHLYRFLMEKYYMALEERTLSLQFDSALERYQKLLNRHPFILQRASLGSIASYLGMSPVTLSRMRALV